MISTRILDNDMGAVAKVPLTGKGTIHGITVELDVAVAQEKDMNGKFVDVTSKVKLPEIDMSLLEMLSSDMGVTRFTDHCEEHLGNVEIEKLFISAYTTFVTPLNKSGR